MTPVNQYTPANGEKTTQIKTFTAESERSFSAVFFLSLVEREQKKNRGNEPFSLFFAFSLEITDDVLLEIAEQEDKTKCS